MDEVHSAPITTVDTGVFFYQDYGLEYTRVSAPGSFVWYSWFWNWRDIAGYQPDREHVLGFYEGDHPSVLRRQVKDLVGYGVNFMIIQQGGSIPDSGGAWTIYSNANYWIWQLMTNVKAVRDGFMKLVFWLPGAGVSGIYQPSAGAWVSGTSYTTGQSALNTAYDNRQYVALRGNVGKQPNSNPLDWALRPMPNDWTLYINFLTTNKAKIKTVDRAGKAYPLTFFFETESCRAVWGTGTFNNWLADFAAGVRAAIPEWGGICILMRTSPAPSLVDGVAGVGLINYDSLEAQGVFILRTDYSGLAASSGATGTYQSIIDRFPTFPGTSVSAGIGRRVYVMPTALVTMAPHPSTFSFVGHSPVKFGQLCTKVVAEVLAGRGYPMILVNGFEIAEAGPGLYENVQDGHGYGNALLSAIT